jgi:hypothetical protein
MRIMFNIIRYINLLYSFQPNNYSNLIERIGFPIDIKNEAPKIMNKETKPIKRFNNNIENKFNSTGTQSI